MDADTRTQRDAVESDAPSVARDIPAWVDYVMVALIAVALRALTAGSQSLWYDETFTAQIVDGPFSELLDTVRDTETTPAFSYVVGWLWAQLAGTGDVALRMPAIVFGAAAALVGMRAAALLAGRRAAIATGILLAVNPFAVWFGQEARAYALLELAGAGLVLALVTWQRRPVAGIALWSGFSVLAIATHYPGWVAAVAALAAAAALRAAWPRIEVILTALALPLLTAAVNAPMLLDQESKGRTNWIGETTLWDRVLQGSRQFMTGLEAPQQRALGIACAVVVVGLCALALRARRATWAVGAFLGIGIALLLLGALAGVDIVLARNAIWLLPALLVLTGCACAAATNAQRGVTTLLVAVLAVAWVGASYVITTDDEYARPDWRSAIRALPDDTEVVFVDPWMQRELVRWYAPDIEPRSLPIQHGDADVDHDVEHDGVYVLGGDVTPAGAPWQQPGSVVTSTGEPLACTPRRDAGVVFVLRCRP